MVGGDLRGRRRPRRPRTCGKPAGRALPASRLIVRRALLAHARLAAAVCSALAGASMRQGCAPRVAAEAAARPPGAGPAGVQRGQRACRGPGRAEPYGRASANRARRCPRRRQARRAGILKAIQAGRVAARASSAGGTTVDRADRQLVARQPRLLADRQAVADRHVLTSALGWFPGAGLLDAADHGDARLAATYQQHQRPHIGIPNIATTRARCSGVGARRRSCAGRSRGISASICSSAAQQAVGAHIGGVQQFGVAGHAVPPPTSSARRVGWPAGADCQDELGAPGV